MGKGGAFDRILNRDRDRPSQVRFQSVTPNVYTPEEYTQQSSQLGSQYIPARFEFDPYAQAYLNQLSLPQQFQQSQQPQPQQFQQTLSPNLASGLAALAEAYGIANPLAPTAPASAPAPAASTSSAAE
jgi:hypothetical protein